MNTCKNESCNSEVMGKAIYCSARCRKAVSRSVTKCDTGSVTSASVTPSVTSEPVLLDMGRDQSQLDEVFGKTASLEHYQANPDQYAARTNPELLDWGKPMTLNELNKAKLKANRVTIPGDWDYTGGDSGRFSSNGRAQAVTGSGAQGGGLLRNDNPH